jgi:formylglycine-generating enzyme
MRRPETAVVYSARYELGLRPRVRGGLLSVFLGLCVACSPRPAQQGRGMERALTCPPDMARVALSGAPARAPFCMDVYEASVVELLPSGLERPHSSYQGVGGLVVRAKSVKGVIPQGYISQIQSAAACANAGKRLCTEWEFETACSGGDPANFYPYGGQTRMPGYCNEGKGSSMPRLFGKDPAAWTSDAFNDPRLNQDSSGLAPTGSFTRCVSPFGIHDCVGNLHEWGADPVDEQGRSRFRGGFYGDAENNGHGCRYVTRAHGPGYHDYSTGFRCCADAR